MICCAVSHGGLDVQVVFDSLLVVNRGQPIQDKAIPGSIAVGFCLQFKSQ
jgi:hypothetical protein